jgi:hypothetical protein
MLTVKRSLKWIALTSTLFLFVALVVFSLVRPLLPSRDYTVTATLDGHPIQTELLHPPLISGRYYMRILDDQARRHDSFGIAFSRQSVCWPGTHYTGWFGLRYIHTDQAMGVRLTDPKMEEHWSVAFTSDGVQFSNSSLSIVLKRNP